MTTDWESEYRKYRDVSNTELERLRVKVTDLERRLSQMRACLRTLRLHFGDQRLSNGDLSLVVGDWVKEVLGDVRSDL